MTSSTIAIIGNATPQDGTRIRQACAIHFALSRDQLSREHQLYGNRRPIELGAGEGKVRQNGFIGVYDIFVDSDEITLISSYSIEYLCRQKHSSIWWYVECLGIKGVCKGRYTNLITKRKGHVMHEKLLAFGLAAIVGLVSASTANAQNFNLRFAHYLSKGPFLEVEENFAKRVEQRTDGKVKISTTYSGGLGGGNEVLGLVGRGGVDMAAVVPGYYPDQLLFWKASQIPFVFDSPGKAINVITVSSKDIPAYKQELDKLGAHFLFQQPLGSFYLTGSNENCDTLAGLKGKKVRAFGADLPKIVSAAGATPVTIQVVDIYEALQRNTLDYSFLNLGNISANKLQEVAKYTCGPVMSIGGHMVLMSKRVWDRLPENYKTIINEEAAKAQQEYIDWLTKNDQETIQALQKAGHVIKPFNPNDLAKWKAQSPDLLQAWSEDMAKRGQAESANTVLKRWREMTKN